jgi:ParB-like chromosome segregation protein Spo0J
MSDEQHVSEIIVGTRHRKDMGDIRALATSIREVGLLHPIVIRPDGTLIAGARRLAAVQELDWRRIPVRVVDVDSIALGEAAENLQRKDFTPSELVAIGAAVEERELAKARQLAGKPLPETFGKDRHDNETSSRVAAPLGFSGRTYEKARTVVEAANDNEKFAPLVEEMDRTGKVNGAFKKLRQLQGEGHHDLASDAKPAHGPVYSDAKPKHEAKPELDVFAEKLATTITNIFSGQLGEQIRAVVKEREHLSGKRCRELRVALTTVECSARGWREQLDGDNRNYDR